MVSAFQDPVQNALRGPSYGPGILQMLFGQGRAPAQAPNPMAAVLQGLNPLSILPPPPQGAAIPPGAAPVAPVSRTPLPPPSGQPASVGGPVSAPQGSNIPPINWIPPVQAPPTLPLDLASMALGRGGPGIAGRGSPYTTSTPEQSPRGAGRLGLPAGAGPPPRLPAAQPPASIPRQAPPAGAPPFQAPGQIPPGASGLNDISPAINLMSQVRRDPSMLERDFFAWDPRSQMQQQLGADPNLANQLFVLLQALGRIPQQ